MMQSMKGATMLLGSMNRQMNLPALQKIAMDFERENEIMDQRQEMMDDAIDEATGLEDEEESEDIVKEVLDEIGVDLGQAVRAFLFAALAYHLLILVCSSVTPLRTCKRLLWQTAA
jgi:division protein CdvB (Snf7/Vps24/ESCRT-III family)